MSTLSEAVSGASWSMRSRGRHVYGDYTSELIVSRYPIRASGGRDMVLWKHSEDVYKDQFSATRRWECIRASNPKVHWYRLVWFAQGISRHAFIVWLSPQDRLLTGSQMRSWGIMQSCVFFVGGVGGGGQ